MSALISRRRSSASAAAIAARSAPSSATKKTSIWSGSTSTSPTERSSRSMPAPKPIAGVGPPPGPLDQAVVAAAAADSALRADCRVAELEGRAGVVVEAAHERRLELVRDADGVEQAAALGEVDSALLAERVADLRRIREQLLHPLALHVEHSEGRRRALRAGLLVELGLVLVQPGFKALDVAGAAVRIADRVEEQNVVGEVQPPQELGVEVGGPGA